VAAIKPLSRGQWLPGAPRTRKWWYQPTEDLHELDLALRYTLSQQQVTTVSRPPS